jgi:hypothetical protein
MSIHKYVEEFELWSSALINFYIILGALTFIVSRWLKVKLSITDLGALTLYILCGLGSLAFPASDLWEAFTEPHLATSDVIGAGVFGLFLSGFFIWKAWRVSREYIKKLPRISER